MAEAAIPAITRDSFLSGRITLEQPATGHRIGTDAVLLLALARGLIERRSRQGAIAVADFGAGAGLVGLGLALLQPEAHVWLAERDAAIAMLAERNRLGLGPDGAARASILTVDVTQLGTGQTDAPAAASLDLVVMNPPFLVEGTARLSPDAYRQAAHSLPAGGLAEWLRAARRMLRPGGQVALIHRADAIGPVLEALATGFGAVRLIAIHPREGADATRILVSATLQSKAPATIGPALILHEASGRFTSLAARLHAGDATL